MATGLTSNANGRNRARVGGSGFTYFTFMGERIAFAQQVDYVSPQPVSGPVAIHPMDAMYPVQVITPAAASMGSITLNLYELYNAKVWDRLGAKVGYVNGSLDTNTATLGNALLTGAIDIVDVFIKVAAAKPSDLGVVKYINPPVIAGQQGTKYREEFHNCVITDIRDGESIQVGTMEVIKQITVGFTHLTRNGVGTKRPV